MGTSGQHQARWMIVNLAKSVISAVVRSNRARESRSALPRKLAGRVRARRFGWHGYDDLARGAGLAVDNRDLHVLGDFAGADGGDRVAVVAGCGESAGAAAVPRSAQALFWRCANPPAPRR